MKVRFVFNWYVSARWQLIESLLRQKALNRQGRWSFEVDLDNLVDPMIIAGAVAMVLDDDSHYISLRDDVLTLHAQEPIALSYDLWQKILQESEDNNLLDQFLAILFSPEEIEKAQSVVIAGRPPEEDEAE